MKSGWNNLRANIVAVTRTYDDDDDDDEEEGHQREL